MEATSAIKKLQNKVNVIDGVKGLVGIKNLLSKNQQQIYQDQQKRSEYEAQLRQNEKERIARYLKMPEMLGEENIN